jgi:predicted CopG family antitoxin
MNKSTVVIEALDHKWELSSNSVAEDCLRRSSEGSASVYIFRTLEHAKPAARRAALMLLLPYFGDVTSALVSIDGESNSDLINSLVDSPKTWIEFLTPFWSEGRDSEITKLWEAACEVNPHWYPADPLKDAPVDSKEIVNKVSNSLNEEAGKNGSIGADIDPATIKAASQELANHAEEVAKKKGKSGR